MSEKTITLSGAEVEVAFSGANAWLRNDGTGTIYAGKAAGVSAGADGVVAVPAGGSAPVYGANGQVFLLGTGSVQLIGSDYSANPFKTSAASGGSGADEVARAAIEAHAGNAEIHVTSAEKAAWDGKADTIDFGSTSTDTKEAVGIEGKCTVYRCSGWTDYPAALTNGQGHIIAINYKGSGTAGSNSMWTRQIYISANININNPRLFQRYISATNSSGWVDIADGGNAASVGAYTEAKLAALEARVAALEGK